ncbi:MAG TPA: hypothetical protein PKZ77_00195, partial [Pseudomonadales bacterium]|nr:hypothetical protein [Pseudomonadales bacterium]
VLDTVDGTAYEGRRTTAAAGGRALYFAVDPAWLRGDVAVEVQVTFVDDGCGAWALEYATADGVARSPEVACGADGSVRTVVASALTLPGGIAVDGRTLYVADTFSIAAVELPAGHVRDVSRTLNDSAYPQLAATAPGHLATASTQTGFLQLRDTATGAVIGRWSGLAQPLALAMPDAGHIAVAEAAAGGRLLLLDAQDSTARRLIASGFDTPGGLVATADGYVLTGQGVGEVILLGHDGTRRTLTSGLARPQGIAALSDGSLVLVETGARRLLRLDPHSGEISVVAQDLPLGIAGREGQAPEAAPIGVAVDARDTIYLGLDRDGSILRLRRH